MFECLQVGPHVDVGPVLCRTSVLQAKSPTRFRFQTQLTLVSFVYPGLHVRDGLYTCVV